jgi:hypothetical protein
VSLALVCILRGALLAQLVPDGGEFQVNTYTTPSFQLQPAVASNLGGEFVVTWITTGQDGSDRGIFARRYDGSGAALGG